MPIRNCSIEYLRVQPGHGERDSLNGDGVNAGGAVPDGSDAVHMPMTGCAFTSLASPDSSSAVTATDNVRLACAERK